MSADDDMEIDGFLDSDESVESLMAKQFGPEAAEAEADVLDQFRPSEMPGGDDTVGSTDGELIKRVGMAMADTDVGGVGLDLEFSDAETVVATHGSEWDADRPVADAIVKATEDSRQRTVAANLSKREMLDLAGEAVDDFFRENVKEEGLDDDRLNELKFAARRRVLKYLDDQSAEAE